MTKFKVGDRVAKLDTGEERTIVKADRADNQDTYTLKNKNGFQGFHWWHNDNLTLIERKEKTMEDLKKGDVIYNNFGAHTILARLEDLVWFSYHDSPEKSLTYCLISELDDLGYYLKPEPTEMTVAEVEEKLGHPVKIIKGKK